jgi:hypothetical protein
MIIERSASELVKSFVPSFKLEEFFCKCGKCGPQNINLEAVLLLQKLRDVVGPIKIESPYRCPKYNKVVGGAPKSQHLSGIAYDISTKSLGGFALAVQAYKVGFRSFGIAKGWCHVDCRPTDGIILWTYGNLDEEQTRKDFENAIKIKGASGVSKKK